MIQVLLCVAILCPDVFAEESSSTQIGSKQQRQIYRWLCSEDSDTRRRAHQFLSQLSENDSSVHKRLLNKARLHHATPLENALERTYKELQPFAEARRNWTYERKQALTLGRKNLDYDTSDLKKLDQLLHEASRTYRQLQAQALAATNVWKALEPHGKILLELDIELAILKSDEEEAFKLSLGDVFEEFPFGDNAIHLIKQAKSLVAQRQQSAQVDSYNNDSAKWPTSSQRGFAKIINEMRIELGLSPLYLQKELSLASINHCAEMAKLGYFAHQSPTPANASPSKRAKNAMYSGRWQGENIYKGSSSPMAAYVAWWKSDGHRKVMIANGPNHLGIGLVKAHWTLSLGAGRSPSKD